VERRRDAIRGALPAAIQHLTAHGVDAKSAEKNLVLLLKRLAPSAIHDAPVASSNS
jgi:hypothetical protein